MIKSNLKNTNTIIKKFNHFLTQKTNSLHLNRFTRMFLTKIKKTYGGSSSTQPKFGSFGLLGGLPLI